MVAELLRWMLYRDPPDHRRLRGLASKAFSPRIVEGMRGRIQRIVDQLIAEHAERGAMDVIPDVAFVLPVLVICELLRLPTEERGQCAVRVEAVSRGLDPLQTPETVARADAAVLDMADYMHTVVSARRRSPGEDLLTALIAVEAEGSRLSEPELISMVNLLLFAGHQTTRDLIGNGLLALLRHPAETARLLENPSLIVNAVDKLTRYDSPAQMVPRWAREDVEVDGCRIPAGDQVSLFLGAANRDPEPFPKPNCLDLARPNSGSLLSFGAGIHFCLGAALARLEAQIGLLGLVRLRELTLVDDGVRRRPQLALRSLEALPVTFAAYRR
jgi:cytochrome P450